MLSKTWTSEPHGIKTPLYADATTHLRWAPSRQNRKKCLLFRVYLLDVVSRNLLHINAIRITRYRSGRVMQTTHTHEAKRKCAGNALHLIGCWAMKMPFFFRIWVSKSTPG